MEQFVNNTLNSININDYSFTGHSLGGALAQYMAVLKDKNATTFVAARAYRLLPPDLQKLVDSGYFKEKIKNYRHDWDPVGYFPGGTIIGSDFTAKSSGNPLSAHTRGSFKGMFKNGSMELSDEYQNTVKNQLTAIYRDEKLAYLSLSDLRDKLTKSNGKLTSNEEIFLNNSETLIAISSLSQKIATALDGTISRYQKSIEQAEKLWTKTNKAANDTGSELTSNEISDALKQGGATKETIFTKQKEKYEAKITELQQLTETFDGLISDIKFSIEKLVETDQDLATQLS